TSKSGVLYIGVTNRLKRRVLEHRLRLVEGFATIQRHKTCSLGALPRHPRRHRTRETNQRLAALKKNRTDRIHKPQLERFSGSLFPLRSRLNLCRSPTPRAPVILSE